MASISGPENYYAEFIKGIWKENPVFIQVLGMCPMLAVTNSAINALAMGAATFFVLVGSSLLVSAFKNVIPKQVRISCYIIIIATFVTVADLTLLAFVPDIHKELGAFIALIVVNCIILGRAEAFASKNSLGKSILDALGMGVGFTFALLCLGIVREVLGAGTLFDIPITGERFQAWSIMLLPGGGFFTLGAWLLLFSFMKERKKAKAVAK